VKIVVPATRKARDARGWLMILLLAVGALTPTFVSCADSGKELEGGPELDGGEDAETSDAHDGGGDCDAGDAGCTHAVTCDETDWSPVATTSIDKRRTLTSIWGSGKNDVWVVGSAGTIAHFDGTTWTTIPSGTKETLRAVWGSSATDVWVVSTPGVLLHGNGWNAGTASFDLAPEIPRVVDNVATLTLAVWGSSPDDVWLGGEPMPLDWDLSEHAPAWRKADPGGGVGWENVFVARSTDRVTVRSIWGSGPNDVWAVGGDDDEVFNPDGTQSVVSRGRTFHASSDGSGGALQWKELDSQSSSILYAVWGSGPGDVWAVGRRGTIRRFKTGASRWETVSSPTTENLRGLWGSGPSDVWAVGDNGTLLHFDGASWETSSAAFPPGPKPNLYGVWGSGADDVWAVGEDGLLHFSGHTNNGGAP